MMSSLSFRFSWIALVGSILVTIAGCGGDKPTANSFTGFTIIAPSDVQAGDVVGVLVLARGSAVSPFSSYRGTVQIDSDDAKADFLPPSYTFTDSDAGLHTFTVVFKTAGKHTIHVMDTATKAVENQPLSVTARGPAQIVVVSGNGQRGIGGKPLPAPLVAKVTDTYGNGISGAAVTWAVASGGGAVTPGGGATAADGTVSAKATLGVGRQANAYTASADDVPHATFSATRNLYRLVYKDSTTGIVRLVRNAASNDTTVVLDFIAAQAPALSVYAAGFNLPLDATKVALDPTKPFALPATLSLNPGSAPQAATAALPLSGPLAGTLVTVLSQKAMGAGAIATDTAIKAGAVLYSVTLNLQPDGMPGVVFDGTGKPAITSGGLRNKVGELVVSPKDVGIGKLEVVE
jgi:hypothetical protein